MCVCGLGLADLVSNEVKATRRSAGRGGRTVRYHMIEYAEKFFGECWMRGGFGEPGRGMGWEGMGNESASREQDHQRSSVRAYVSEDQACGPCMST